MGIQALIYQSDAKITKRSDLGSAIGLQLKVES